MAHLGGNSWCFNRRAYKALAQPALSLSLALLAQTLASHLCIWRQEEVPVLTWKQSICLSIHVVAKHLTVVLEEPLLQKWKHSCRLLWIQQNKEASLTGKNTVKQFFFFCSLFLLPFNISCFFLRVTKSCTRGRAEKSVAKPNSQIWQNYLKNMNFTVAENALQLYSYKGQTEVCDRPNELNWLGCFPLTDTSYNRPINDRWIDTLFINAMA